MSSTFASPTVSLTPGAAGDSARASAGVSTFRLDNGLEIVVIPDTRTPVVTHMIWYKNGSADDPIGKSGIAHFLEHLMFKGTVRRMRSHPTISRPITSARRRNISA